MQCERAYLQLGKEVVLLHGLLNKLSLLDQQRLNLALSKATLERRAGELLGEHGMVDEVYFPLHASSEMSMTRPWVHAAADWCKRNLPAHRQGIVKQQWKGLPFIRLRTAFVFISSSF